MRISVGLRTAMLAVTVFSSGMLAAIPDGAAQSVFSEFFSWIVKPSAPKPQKPQTVQRGPDPYLLAPRAMQPQMSYRSWKYRTVCVRLCDGYYFPINHSSSRSNFHSDAQQCQSRCQGETQLYYMPSSTSDINQARDISGKPYKRLENAFLYRKKYVANCVCRPAPWSPEERARHAMYDSPLPKVAINDQVLDKVAANLDKPAVDGDNSVATNPYLNVASVAGSQNPYRASKVRRVARKRPRGSYMSLGVKPKKVKRVRSRARRRNWKDAILGGSQN